MKYCADCVSMETGGHDKGMFDCTNPKSGYKVVSARKPACSHITECFNSRRSETERERLMAISREYHCYIVGAIVRTLNMDSDMAEYYLSIFDYFRNTIMPSIEGGTEWVQDYDTYGPEVAKKVEGREVKCAHLFATVIKPFTDMVIEQEVEAAIDLYTNMYSELKRDLGIGESEKKLAPKPVTKA